MNIVPFPTKAAHHAAAAARLAPVVEARWSEHHLPLIRTAIELLELTDDAFTGRMHAMRDGDGLSLIAELVGEFRTTSAFIETIFRSLYLIRVRLDAGLSALQAAETL